MRSKTAADRLSDFKLATRDVLKRIGTERRRPASSCNALAVDTFSSVFKLKLGLEHNTVSDVPFGWGRCAS